jgi:hypothetical protein
VDGYLGGALSFSNQNDYVRATNTESFLDGMQSFSLSLWVKSSTSSTDAGLLCADHSSTDPTVSLTAKTSSTCGSNTNVIEGTISSSRGQVRYVSASNATTREWQHLALVWSNGLAPALYLDGQRDQPRSHMVPLAGVLTNCPGFIIGTGPLDWPYGWKGLIDEVRLYPRPLSDGEVEALSACCSTQHTSNDAPFVDAGLDQTVQLGGPVELGGTVVDDGLPDPPSTVITTWTNVAGPVNVTIPDPFNLTNAVQFSETGEYVFRLIADDGEVKTYDEVTLTIIEPTRVDVYAMDPEAAELGPDTGQFTFIRTGDTNFDLTVYLAMSGIASNGLDFVTLPYTVTFSGGAETVDWVVTPFLDHRTEGDQDLTLTIITNAGYTVGNGQTTIIIHDSPYGVWSIDHFTLEELTEPSLSGEAADFDRDGLVNFAEYAVNLDPRSPATNAPMSVILESDPEDNHQRLMITYHRRIEPTDTAYAVSISDDLITWHSSADYVEEISRTDDGNGLTETVTARVVAPFTGQANQFVTVRMWLLTTDQ